eukprot:10916950-Alexandrium_andersonii.AAC.1
MANTRAYANDRSAGHTDLRRSAHARRTGRMDLCQWAPHGPTRYHHPARSVDRYRATTLYPAQ